MADTMEDVVDGESGLELSADEEAHIKFLRDENISAKHVSDRIKPYINRPAPAPDSTSSAPPPSKEQTVTPGEVRKMFVEYDQKAKQTARAREAQKEIKGAIGKLVDESGLTKRAKRRDRIVGEVFDSLCDREDVAKLTDEDFQKVLVDETKKAITEEREDDGAPPTSSSSSSNDEGRKTAAEAMGQTTGNEPPPKSAAKTERPARGARVNAENVDQSFGAAEVDWSISDAEIEQESAREGEKFLKKARGG